MLNSTIDRPETMVTDDVQLTFPINSVWQTKSSEGLVWASLSDVHLGHPKCPTVHILESLGILIPDTAETGKIDILTIAGDLFDRLLTLPEEEVKAINRWIRRLLWICQKYNIVLRVLEGTPSHDRMQSAIISELLDTAGYTVDYQYVTTLSIERIERLGIDVLYVPDEWRRDPMDTYREAQALMAERGITQVDFAVMHGAFEYQLPEVARKNHPTHDSALWMAMVRYVIWIGHIHKFSQYGPLGEKEDQGPIIVAHGSTDRLSHNEEEPKGMVKALITPQETRITFVENRNAMIFRTLDVAGMEMAQVVEVIEKQTSLPNGSHLRLSGIPGDPALAGIREIMRQYPQFHFTPHSKKVKDEETEVAPAHHRRYVPRQITRGNLPELVVDWLKRKRVEQWQIEHCEALLNEQLP